WLWAVRIYKTRTQAGEACKGGKVKIQGVNVKPSREIKEGDIIEVQQKLVKKTIKVVQLVKNRVGPKLVDDLLEDLTPAEEYERYDMIRLLNHEKRNRGEGRPTKRERREIDRLKNI
ncbi:MAG: RNA-binding protein, partial [Marinilabiliales bacterium]